MAVADLSVNKQKQSHIYEMNCGGGGGPAGQDCAQLTHEFETNCGGGGGPDRKIERVDYVIEHVVDLKRKRVNVEVKVNLKNYYENIWKQVIGVAEERIFEPKCFESKGGKKLASDFEGDAVVVTLKEKDHVSTNFVISYGLRLEDFFNEYETESQRFKYADSFDCDYLADLFKISFNFPDYMRIHTIRPLPVDFSKENKLIWVRDSVRQHNRLRIQMEGEFLKSK